MTTAHDWQYKPAHSLVRWLSILLIVYLLANTAAAGCDWLEISILTELQGGVDVPEARLDASDRRQMTMGFLQVGIGLPTALLFFVWVYRANHNAHALGSSGMVYTPGWCVAYFFIPILHVFRPYQAIRETWRSSDPQVTIGQQSSTPGILKLWWALYLTSSIFGHAAFRTAFSAGGHDELLFSSWLMFCSDFLEVPLGFVELCLVRGLQRRQHTKSRTLSASPPDAGERGSNLAG
jgi:hypothetical protein